MMLESLGKKAKQASFLLMNLDADVKTKGLLAISAALKEKYQEILNFKS